MIYFIHAAAMKAVKIGWTEGDPMERLRSLQTGCPDRLVLLLAVAGGRKDESLLKEKFGAIRIHGEWFQECPELMSEIEERSLSLCPVAGTNPRGYPVPQSDLLRSFRSNEISFPELCYLTSIAVGHSVSISTAECVPDPELLESLIGTRKKSYQAMRWDESDGPGDAFWTHHLWERPQWYATPEEACAAYVASYLEWRKGGGEP